MPGSRITLCDRCVERLYGTGYPPAEELPIASIYCEGCKRFAETGAFRTFRAMPISIVPVDSKEGNHG
jgi:hypothetical protein